MSVQKYDVGGQSVPVTEKFGVEWCDHGSLFLGEELRLR